MRPLRRDGPNLMPEMPDAGEDHRDIMLIGGGDDVRVFHRAARLDGRSGSGLRCGDESVWEGEERIATDDAADEIELCLARLPYRDAA